MAVLGPDVHSAHGYWLEEAGPSVNACPGLSGSIETDICVVGGGYLGLWTAWYLRRTDPRARVVVLEADVCGRGPSGRNGGIVNPLWEGVPALRERHGDEAALAVGQASADAVAGLGEWCRAHAADAWYDAQPLVEVSTAPSQDGRWLEAARACAELGVGESYRAAGAEEIAPHFASGRVRGGAIVRPAATVQPARLANALRGAVADAGVAVFERSAVTGVEDRRAGVLVHTASGGAVEASVCVVAVNAALAGWPGFRRRLSVASSHMVITEPVADVYQAHRWNGGPITDRQTLLHYFRGTPDRRIALGWGGGPMGLGGRRSGRLGVDRFSVREAIRGLIGFFPELEGRRVTHAWGGPIDVSPVHAPVFCRQGNRCFGYGFTGNGVGPSFLGGQILADLALERRTALTELAIVNPKGLPRFPPEPFRYLGASVIRRAMIRRDRAEGEGRRAGAIARLIADVPRRLKMNLPR